MEVKQKLKRIPGWRAFSADLKKYRGFTNADIARRFGCARSLLDEWDRQDSIPRSRGPVFEQLKREIQDARDGKRATPAPASREFSSPIVAHGDHQLGGMQEALAIEWATLDVAGRRKFVRSFYVWLDPPEQQSTETKADTQEPETAQEPEKPESEAQSRAAPLRQTGQGSGI